MEKDNRIPDKELSFIFEKPNQNGLDPRLHLIRIFLEFSKRVKDYYGKIYPNRRHPYLEVLEFAYKTFLDENVIDKKIIVYSQIIKNLKENVLTTVMNVENEVDKKLIKNFVCKILVEQSEYQITDFDERIVNRFVEILFILVNHAKKNA